MFSQSGSEALLPISFTVNSIPGSIQSLPPSIPNPPRNSRLICKPTWTSSSPSPSTSTAWRRASVLVFRREKSDALKETISYPSII